VTEAAGIEVVLWIQLLYVQEDLSILWKVQHHLLKQTQHQHTD